MKWVCSEARGVHAKGWATEGGYARERGKVPTATSGDSDEHPALRGLEQLHDPIEAGIELIRR